MGRVRPALALVAVLAAACAPLQPGQDVPFVTTPPNVVEAMLRLASVGPDDVVYDLGSGDGRIVITAAWEFGARGVGVEIVPALVAESRRAARRAGVADRVRFVQQDVFDVDLRDATVVTIYMSDAINERLRPKLLRELRRGARIVSYRFRMGDWAPDRRSVVVADGGERDVYLWIAPGPEAPAPPR
jgi:SAM-dependent methyltransferase